ncbi:hypothetical protein H8356DRAFT_1428661 [Neocallimastix lanati (nom. inval.)]|nr:hypothetical protein H8356DRAFT_1428661 [Neocallimastix sp. JGI-2020a]
MDLHKWKNFLKIVCVEPDHEKIKVLKECISKSEIRNQYRIKDIYYVATCFFALNDFSYINISRMLSNISKNINGIFCLYFLITMYLPTILIHPPSLINNVSNKKIANLITSYQISNHGSMLSYHDHRAELLGGDNIHIYKRIQRYYDYLNIPVP